MRVHFPLWIALLLSLILVPILRKVSLRLGFVDVPKIDRWHKKPTPKIGGIAIFISFIAAILFTHFFVSEVELHWPFLVGAIITFFVGVLDDFKPLSPAAKLIGQILAAAIVVFFGRNLEFFDLEIFNIIFTFGWLIVITNAINLLDNMDGVAGGVALIAALMLSLMFWQVQTLDLLLISLALAGGTLGFLVYNFPPASVFMGDGGSLFLGFSLASLAIAQVPRASNLLSILGVPTLIFLLPILDTTMVTITRVMRGQSPAVGGKDHTSHRLIAFGLSERQTVLVLYLIALISGIMGSFLEAIDYNISLLLIPLLLLVLTLLTAYLARIKVVETSDSSHQPRTITRLMIRLSGRGRLPEIIMDLVIVLVSYYVAFGVYFSLDFDILSSEHFLGSLPIVIASVYLSFFALGIYSRIWQYITFRDLFRFLLAVLGSAFVIIVMILLFYPIDDFPITVIFLFAGFLFLGLAGSRLSFRLLDQVYAEHSREIEPNTSVIIFGADDTGVMVLQWLNHNPENQYNAIGFLDDDPFKRGRQIHGVSVIGNLDDLAEIVDKYNFQGIIFPSDEMIKVFQKSSAMDLCKNHGIWLKRLRVNFEVVK